MILFFEEMAWNSVDELEYKLQGSRLVEIQLFPSTTWSCQSAKQLGLRNHVQVHYNVLVSPWLPRINQCVPSTAEYATLINNILTSKFNWIYFCPTPPIKLKLTMQISGTLLISTHLDQSNYSSQSTAGFRFLNQLSEHLVQKCRAKTKICWDKSGCFDFS